MALRGILELVLKVDPGRIDSAFNGEEAVEAVMQTATHEGSCYSLILMDLNMPFMDGFEATKQIKERLSSQFNVRQSSHPKVVAVTGHVEPEYIQKCY